MSPELNISTVTTDNGGADTALSSTAGDDRVSGVTSTGFFTITFDEAMDPETVIADNITLTCNAAAITVGTPVTSDNIIWTIPVEVNLGGYVGCTLTFGTGIKDAAGNELAEAATYAFNTQCSTVDTFVVDTLGFTTASQTAGNCWTYSFDGVPYNPNSTVFSVSTDQLIFTTPTGANSEDNIIFKGFSATSFTATLELVGQTQGGSVGCNLLARHATDSTKYAMVETASGSNCFLDVSANHGATVTPACALEIASPQAPFYLQLTWDGTTASGKVGTSLSALTTLTPPGGGADAVALGSSYLVGVMCEGNTAGTVARIGSFTINATATTPGTQY